MPRVAVIFTGGTISMQADDAAGGNIPTLDGAAILARTPGLREIAEVVEMPVHLVLFVKVREGWGDDPERYREMGLEFPRD